MQASKIKGYLLTYLGWLIGFVASLGVTSILTYFLFRHAFLSQANYEKQGWAGLGTDVVTGLLGIVFALITFQICNLVLAPFLVSRLLKPYAESRRRTSIWLFVLLFLAPVPSVISLFLSNSITACFYVTSIWMLLSPFLARFIATR